MAIEKLTKDLNIIQKLDDEPNDVGGLTSAELKAEFDKAGNEIKEYLNATVVPAINAVQTQADASTADQHTHSNKALLDTYDQTNADIADAIAKEHTHSNKSVLDAFTADQQAVLAGIKEVTQILGNAADKVPSEAAVAKAMSASGNVPAGGTTGQVLAKASENALDVTWKSLEAKDVGAAPAGYGLGGSAQDWFSSDFNDYTSNGWWRFGSVASFTNAPPLGYGVLRVDCRESNLCQQTFYALGDGIVMQRYHNGSSWQPWEWVNPPMFLGVEYRTTERYTDENGVTRPVYAKRLNIGVLDGTGVTLTFNYWQTTPGVGKVVEAYGNVGNTLIPNDMGAYAGDTITLSVMGNTITVKTFGSWSTGNTPVLVTVKYTKTTD